MDSSNTNFSVGEIVWGKIKGYPWWPAMITETRDDNREKKYICNFIGDNSHASLIKRDLAKFEELKNYSSTKKKIYYLLFKKLNIYIIYKKIIIIDIIIITITIIIVILIVIIIIKKRKKILKALIII